jgi:hypothetical protein
MECSNDVFSPLASDYFRGSCTFQGGVGDAVIGLIHIKVDSLYHRIKIGEGDIEKMSMFEL